MLPSTAPSLHQLVMKVAASSGRLVMPHCWIEDQYAPFGVNALDSAHSNFSKLFLSPSGREWLFREIEEMNITIQCLGSERMFIVIEPGPIFSLVVCGECCVNCLISLLKSVLMCLSYTCIKMYFLNIS